MKRGRVPKPLAQHRYPLARIRRDLDALGLETHKMLEALLGLTQAAGRMSVRIRELRQDLGEPKGRPVKVLETQEGGEE